MIIGERIRNIREDKDILQQELADAVGINVSVLSRIEKGTRQLRDDELIKIADKLNVSVDYLLGRTDEPQGTGFQKGDNGGSQNDGEREKIPPHRKDYVELHRLIDELPHKDVEELLNTALFKKRKAEHLHEHVDAPDDF